MGVAVLTPQDCLKHPLSHMKHPRNPSACPNKQKKPVSNRTRRSPPRTVKKSPNNNNNNNNVVVAGQVRLLKRGEEVPKKTSSDPVVKKTDLARIRPDPEMIPGQIRLPVRKSKTVPFYAGPVTMTSPPPSDVPLPAFFAGKKSVSLFQAADATNDIIRMLGLNIA